MEKEIHADVIEEFDKRGEKAKTMKEVEKFQKEETKRVGESVGWYEPYTYHYKACDEKGISYQGGERKEEEFFAVNMCDGGRIDVKDQNQAEVLSHLAQILFVVRRLEKRVEKLEKRE